MSNESSYTIQSSTVYLNLAYTKPVSTINIHTGIAAIYKLPPFFLKKQTLTLQATLYVSSHWQKHTQLTAAHVTPNALTLHSPPHRAAQAADAAVPPSRGHPTQPKGVQPWQGQLLYPRELHQAQNKEKVFQRVKRDTASVSRASEDAGSAKENAGSSSVTSSAHSFLNQQIQHHCL